MITLIEMKRIIAIADTGGSLSAGKVCCRSDVTMRNTLLRVEKELGVKLFNRAQGFVKWLSVSEVGALIIDQMRVAVSEAEKVKAIAKSFV